MCDGPDISQKVLSGNQGVTGQKIVCLLPDILVSKASTAKSHAQLITAKDDRAAAEVSSGM